MRSARLIETGKICAFRPLVIGFRVARDVVSSGFFRLRSLLFAHFMRFVRSFSCANGSFFLLNE